MTAPIVLSASVGRNGTNAADDVAAVTARLVALGFTWAATDLPRAIGLFQAIKDGRSTVKASDCRVDPNGDTLRWLNAANAPRWVRMTESAPGLHNHEATQRNDHHDYGTDWLDGFFVRAAAKYKAARPNAAPLTVNDVSLPEGGDTLQHKGHETGTVADTRLPRRDGAAGGITTASPEYDRDAQRAQLQAMRADPLFKVAYLNDAVLIGEGLCRSLAGHDDHVHVEIRPPARAAA